MPRGIKYSFLRAFSQRVLLTVGDSEVRYLYFRLVRSTDIRPTLTERLLCPKFRPVEKRVSNAGMSD